MSVMTFGFILMDGLFCLIPVDQFIACVRR